MQLSFVLIDENENSRVIVENIVDKLPQVVITKSFSSLKEACKFLELNTVDFVLIDPNFSTELAFSTIEKLNQNLPVILMSARIKDAVKGFNLAAFDFILKPFTADRFSISLRRLLNQEYYRLKQESILEPTYIEVRCNLMTEKIEHNQIDFVEAMGDYVKIVTPKRKYIVLMSMKKINTLLPEQEFFRSHKSFIVNLHKIEQYNGKEILLNGKKIPLSRFRKQAFKDLMQAS